MGNTVGGAAWLAGLNEKTSEVTGILAGIEKSKARVAEVMARAEQEQLDLEARLGQVLRALKDDYGQTPVALSGLSGLPRPRVDQLLRGGPAPKRQATGGRRTGSPAPAPVPAAGEGPVTTMADPGYMVVGS